MMKYKLQRELKCKDVHFISRQFHDAISMQTFPTFSLSHSSCPGTQSLYFTIVSYFSQKYVQYDFALGGSYVSSISLSLWCSCPIRIGIFSATLTIH